MTHWDKRSDMVVHEAEPYNAESDPAVLAESYLTDIDRFYSRNHGPIPDISAQEWSLTVDGLVGTPLSLTLAELQSAFAHHEVMATLQCAGNRRADLVAVKPIPGEDPWGPAAISTAAWTGVRLADVLAAADLDPRTTDIAFDAPDISQLADPPQHYGSSISVAKAAADEVLLVWEMDGQPLPRLHGGPVRVVVPGFIGARSVKWISRITAQDKPSDNHFQATAYRLLPADADPDSAGPGVGLPLSVLSINSAILQPADRSTVTAGRQRIAGYAFSGGGRFIARVEVSTDGGDHWVQADLGKQVGPWAWVLWSATLDLPAGPVTVVARAFDSSAGTQPESPAHLWNPKGYMNNAWPRVSLTGELGS